MVLFTIAVVLFLYTRKHNLQRQGWLYLYRTKLGLKFIEITAKKYARLLHALEYVVIACGYVLMVAIIILLVYTTYIYIRYPFIAQVIKAPPVFPIFPYFTELFNLETFFPPFYFTYFLVSLGIVATVHEFAHGIFARLNRIKIHSTGFAFLGPILGAFVEQDDKDMAKRSKKAQLSVLAAGVFANIITAAIFLALFWLFFLIAFQPAGLVFSDYATTIVNISDITDVEGQAVVSLSGIALPANATFIALTANSKSYFTTPAVFQNTIERKLPFLGVYEDTPAFKAKLTGIIISIEGNKINSRDNLINELELHRPGDTIVITTLDKGTEKKFTLTLTEKNGKAFLGIAAGSQQRKGLLSWIYQLTPKQINYATSQAYTSNLADFGIFIFNLFWWVVTINFLVAIFNMLPAGIFDGGRFFMLTIWGITGKKEWGEKAFGWATWFMLLILALLMVRWAISFF